MSEAVRAPEARDPSSPQSMPGGPLFVGPLGSEGRQRAEGASERAGMSPAFFDDPDAVRRALTDRNRTPPRCIFVDADCPRLEQLVSWIRAEARLFSVPVVVRVRVASDRSYTDAHAFGADDVVLEHDGAAVTRRLANLAEFDPAERPPITQGRAVVAHAEPTRRSVLGRILRQAGFDVHFAADGIELADVASRGDAPALIVTSSELSSDGPFPALDSAGAGGGGPPAVVLGNARDSRTSLAREAEARGRIAVGDEAAPADNLLFLANELLRPDTRNVRASARLLYGGICAFRPAGDLEPIHGLTYNLSREGLYIRTLDPPAPATPLWLELRPPYATAAVHLRGRVVWHRGLRSPGGAAPPGFGLRLEDSSCPPDDVFAYHEGYDALAAERRNAP